MLAHKGIQVMQQYKLSMPGPHLRHLRQPAYVLSVYDSGNKGIAVILTNDQHVQRLRAYNSGIKSTAVNLLGNKH